MLAFNQGRADAVMCDDTVARCRSRRPTASSKLTDDTFLEAPYGIGIKQGNVALKAWVDSRLELMRKKDHFVPILQGERRRRGSLPSFPKNILRPNNKFAYAARRAAERRHGVLVA